jgi:6-phosphogluconolactonase/Glucosamine-6-phosphate isomerase/deaminase
MSEFKFEPAAWIPYKDKKVLERCRNIKREDMEYTNKNGFRVKIVMEATPLFVADCFARIKLSDDNNTRLTMIFPNQWPSAYTAVAEMCNRYNVSCRNVHAFAMDEWADQDGNVAPLDYKAGLGYSFRKYFWGSLREDLRPDVEHWHVLTTKNVNDYTKIIEEIGGGGADVCYSATGWPGHIAFIDPDTEEFKADSIEEFITLGSRIVTQHPLTTAENSMFGCFGCSGDVANVPPKAATIGPKDIANARDHFEMHSLTALGGYNSWQRMISRLTLYGPVSMQCPASLLQLFQGTAYVTEAVAQPFECWETVGY